MSVPSHDLADEGKVQRPAGRDARNEDGLIRQLSRALQES